MDHRTAAEEIRQRRAGRADVGHGVIGLRSIRAGQGCRGPSQPRQEGVPGIRVLLRTRSGEVTPVVIVPLRIGTRGTLGVVRGQGHGRPGMVRRVAQIGSRHEVAPLVVDEGLIGDVRLQGGIGGGRCGRSG